MNEAIFRSYIEHVLASDSIDDPLLSVLELAIILDSSVKRMDESDQSYRRIDRKLVPTGVGSWKKITPFVGSTEISQEDEAIIHYNSEASKALVEGVSTAMIITLDQVLRVFEGDFNKYSNLDQGQLSSSENKWRKIILASGNCVRHLHDWRRIYNNHKSPLKNLKDIENSNEVKKEHKNQIKNSVSILVDSGLEFETVMTKVTSYQLVSLSKIDSHEEVSSKFMEWMQFRLSCMR